MTHKGPFDAPVRAGNVYREASPDVEKKFRNDFKLAAYDPASEKTFVLMYDHKMLIIDPNMPDIERIQRAGDICKIIPLEESLVTLFITGIYCH